MLLNVNHSSSTNDYSNVYEWTYLKQAPHNPIQNIPLGFSTDPNAANQKVSSPAVLWETEDTSLKQNPLKWGIFLLLQKGERLTSFHVTSSWRLTTIFTSLLSLRELPSPPESSNNMSKRRQTSSVMCFYELFLAYSYKTNFREKN